MEADHRVKSDLSEVDRKVMAAAEFQMEIERFAERFWGGKASDDECGLFWVGELVSKAILAYNVTPSSVAIISPLILCSVRLSSSSSVAV